MKRFFSICIFLSLISPLICQTELGIKFGYSTSSLTDGPINFNDGNISKYQLFFDQDNLSGINIGPYAQIKLLGLNFQTEVIFNNYSVKYELIDTDNPIQTPELIKESFRHIDIPLLVGKKFWFLRFYAGPVAHYQLPSNSKLFDIDGFTENVSKFTYGYQTGMGFNIKKLRFDLKYEGNFSKFGNHISYKGSTFTFDDNFSRFILTAGYALK